MESLIHPREEMNQCELNQFQEIPNDKKRTKKSKTFRKQRKRISRREMKELGLYNLPRKTMKYDDYRELNQLWNKYMQEQLGDDLDQLKKGFECTSPHFDGSSGLIHKSDFHGAKIKVIQSKCASLIGHNGIVIMETKETFNILSKDNTMRGKFQIYFTLVKI